MDSHIKSFEIHNFKSIRHAVLTDCKKINLFIGYPNVGKSALLEALSILSYLQPYYGVDLSSLCRIKDASELFFDANTKENITLSIPNRAALQIAYESETQVVLSNQPIANSNRDNSEYLGTSIRFVRGKWAGEVNSESSSIKIKKYIFQRDNNYNSTKTDGTKLFAPFGENLMDVVHVNKEVRKEVAELFRFYGLKLMIDAATNSIRAVKELSDEVIFTIPFHQIADTLQRLIFFTAAIQTNSDAQLLFEEPEAHMFPPYIRKFIADILFCENGNQYFITTHSPIVLDEFMVEAMDDLAVFLIDLKDGETQIRRLSHEELLDIRKNSVDLFFNIENYFPDGDGDAAVLS